MQFVLCQFGMLTFSHNALGKLCLSEANVGNAPYCKTLELTLISVHGNFMILMATLSDLLYLLITHDHKKDKNHTVP